MRWVVHWIVVFPIHVWSWDTFERIVSHWGSVIQVELSMNGRLFSIQISEAKTLLPSHRFCYVGTIGEEKVKVVGVGEVSGDDVDREVILKEATTTMDFGKLLGAKMIGSEAVIVHDISRIIPKSQ
ncbi:hypothetical protein V6N13_018905 [Hibiscus sabdariffa]